MTNQEKEKLRLYLEKLREAIEEKNSYSINHYLRAIEEMTE